MGSTPNDARPSPAHSTRKFLLLLLLTGVYSIAYLLWFWETPLGQVPVLDGRENLILARQIADGSLAKEPFFRAMLYPAVLSLGARAGLDDADLLKIAGVLGVLFHLLCTAAVFGCGWLLWKRAAPAFLGGVLFGLYPPAVYFAAEPLDTTFSLGLVMVAVYLCIASIRSTKTRPRVAVVTKLIASGAAIALAFIARPNFLPVLIALPIVVILFSRGSWERVFAPAIMLAGMLPFLGAYAGWQAAVSGKFGVMPWQGGYSLWVANGPDANGRYYAQKSMISYEGPHQNPARVESEALYREETGTPSPATPAQIDRYWRDKTRAAILADPARWAMLEVKKLYYYLNNFEQYNNKTFSFHKALSPVLNWNPLSWAILFCLATAGLIAACKVECSLCVGLLFIAAAYLAGGLLVFAGDRFRFPLAPFAAVFGGGAILAKAVLPTTRQRLLCLAAAGVALILAFTRFFGVYDTSTFLQDRLLLANASLRAGRDAEAREFALAVLKEHPDRADARHIAGAAQFNEHVTGARPITSQTEWRQVAKNLEGAAAGLLGVDWMRAVAEWNSGQPEAALQTWRRLAAAGPSRAANDSLAILVLSGRSTSSENERLLQLEWQKQSPYVWAARARLEGPQFEQEVTSRIPPAKWLKVKESAHRLLLRIPETENANQQPP